MKIGDDAAASAKTKLKAMLVASFDSTRLEELDWLTLADVNI